MGVDEREASEEAKRRNRALGEQGVTDAFYIEVERVPGEWEVELRQPPPEKQTWWGRIVDVVTSAPWP